MTSPYARAELGGDGVRWRDRPEQLVGGLDHRRQPGGRTGDRFAVAVVAPAHGHGDGAEDERREGHRHDHPDPARRAGDSPISRGSSAPSLAVTLVTRWRTSATSASVRVRSGACSRRR